MRTDDIPVLTMLRQALGFHSDRQKLIAENVANANTPGFVPRDISDRQFESALAEAAGASRGARVPSPIPEGTSPEAAAAMGVPAPQPPRAWRAESTPDSETTINGNAVVLEEQMVKSAETRIRYETALSLYQKSLNLMRLAVRPPGQ